jgi:hypothetical protein
VERGPARTPRRQYAGPGYAARAAQVRLELAIERRCRPSEVEADDVVARLAGLNPFLDATRFTRDRRRRLRAR